MMDLELFHVGIVVPDLTVARARFTELLGVEWGPVSVNDVDMRFGDGREVVIPNSICYSTSAPYLELIEEVAGTPWVCNEYSNIHHIGYYTGALVADTDRLAAAACPREIMDGHGDGPPGTFAYHCDPLGVRIELVNAEIRASMEQFLMQPEPHQPT